jgi:putative PIN family toxin of toxin-antitoxin system
MHKAVLDTNVLVSGLLKRRRGGIPDQILRRVENFRLFLAEEILGETYRVLHYPRIQKRYRLTEREIQDYLTYLRSIATMVTNLPTLTVVTEDPDDNTILACAVKAQADYIVSGDPHLRDLIAYEGITIVSPAEFLKLI